MHIIEENHQALSRKRQRFRYERNGNDALQTGLLQRIYMYCGQVPDHLLSGVEDCGGRGDFTQVEDDDAAGNIAETSHASE